MRQVHTIAPVFDADSRVLILGSFPSVKSRENGFFYGHAQNRFWRVLAAVFSRPVPVSTEEKKALLLECGVALWDVAAQCDIEGSADSTIREVVPNNLSEILSTAKIEKIYLNGSTAFRLYNKLLLPQTQISGTPLPSTSPLNAAWSLERLIDAWQIIKPVR